MSSLPSASSSPLALTLVFTVLIGSLFSAGSALGQQQCSQPSLNNDNESIPEDQGSSIDVKANDNYLDSSCPYVIQITDPPDHGSVTGGPGSATYNPNSNYNGTDSFKYSLTYPGGTQGTATVTVTVTSVNDPPQVNNDSYSTSQGSSVSSSVLDNDSDVEGNLTASLNSSPSTGSLDFNSSGSFTYDPNGNFIDLGQGESQNVSFTYTATDGDGGSNDATATVTVNGKNDAPAAGDNSYSTSQGTQFSENVLNDDSDIDGDNLSASLSSGPSKGDLDFDSNGSFTFNPNGAFEGLDDGESDDVSFTYSAEDGNGGSDGATVTITVNGNNDIPTASNVQKTTKEDQSVTIDLSSQVGDVETNKGNLTLSVSGSGPSNGSVQDNTSSDLKLTYTPDTDFNGTDNFQYQIEDGGGKTATAIVEVTVEQVPDLTFIDGSSNHLGFAPEVTPGTSNNPVGILAFSADHTGATLGKLTLTSSNPGVEGISNVLLYQSSDRNLSSTDAAIAQISTDPNGLSKTLSFNFVPVEIGETRQYLIVSLEVEEDPPPKNVRFTVEQSSDLSVSKGTMSTINSESGGFPLLLSQQAATLPVELTRFEAQHTEDGISLQWRTASEQNNAAFHVQRRISRASTPSGAGASDRSNGWTTVGQRNGAGTTNQPQSYRYTDTELPYDADSLMYRLQQVDTNGEAHFSEPITVERSQVEEVQLKGTYPNPASEQVTIRYAVPSSLKGEARLRLYDLLGRAVHTVAAGKAEGRAKRQLDISGLTSGVYILQLRAGGTVEMRRLTVVR